MCAHAARGSGIASQHRKSDKGTHIQGKPVLPDNPNDSPLNARATSGRFRWCLCRKRGDLDLAV